MNKKIKKFLIILLFVLLGLTSLLLMVRSYFLKYMGGMPGCVTCSEIDFVPFERAVADSDLIFTGRLIGVADVEASTKKYNRAAIFEVTEVLKGPQIPTATIYFYGYTSNECEPGYESFRINPKPEENHLVVISKKIESGYYYAERGFGGEATDVKHSKGKIELIRKLVSDKGNK